MYPPLSTLITLFAVLILVLYVGALVLKYVTGFDALAYAHTQQGRMVSVGVCLLFLMTIFMKVNATTAQKA